METLGFPRTFTLAFVLLGVAYGQTPESAWRSKIQAVRYPPLAEQARIQGDVRLNIKSGIVTLQSGHPILSGVAVEKAKTLGSILGEMNFDVTYHFVLDTPATSTPITVMRGNAFERAVLRMFGLNTEKVDWRCNEGTPPPNDLKESGAVIEIWIHGRTPCLETETAFSAKL